MDPLMQLTANEARIDSDNAIAYARNNPEPDTSPKFHVVTFRSRAKAVALREFALKEQVYVRIAGRGAVFTRHDYDKNRIGSLRRRFEAWWRRAQYPNSRTVRTRALEARIAAIAKGPCGKSVEIEDARAHIDNAKNWIPKAEYDWSEALDEAEGLIAYIEETPR